MIHMMKSMMKLLVMIHTPGHDPKHERDPVAGPDQRRLLVVLLDRRDLKDRIEDGVQWDGIGQDELRWSRG